jgi:DNA-binding MarR family transcriptional regulator
MNNAQADYTAPPAVAAEEQLLALLYFAKGLEERIEQAMAAVELSVAKYGVLTHLVEASQAIPLSDLAARINCARSNVTQMVDRLETEGLVRRTPSPTDRRIILAELTAEGRKRQEAGAEKMRHLEATMASALGTDDRAVIRRAMQALG